MTLLDWLVIFAGFGIAWVMPDPFSVPYLVVPSPAVLIGLIVLRVLLSIAVVITLVVLGRQIVYCRPLWAAEWLAVWTLALLLSATVPDIDNTLDAICRALTGRSDMDFQLWRWCVAVISLNGALVLGVVCAYWRRVMAPWLLTLVFLIAVAILWWGPVDVLQRQLPWPSAAVADWSSPFLVQLYFGSKSACASLPTALLFGVPAVAAVGSLWRRQRRWLWTEWAALVMASLFAVLYLVAMISALLDKTPGEKGAAILVAAVWFAVVVTLSLIVLRCSRWVEGRLIAECQRDP